MALATTKTNTEWATFLGITNAEFKTVRKIKIYTNKAGLPNRARIWLFKARTSTTQMVTPVKNMTITAG